MPKVPGAEYECSVCKARVFSPDGATPAGWESDVSAFGLEEADVCDECCREVMALVGWLKRGKRGPRDMDAGTTLRTLPRDEGRPMDLPATRGE